jgi:L-aminopeptidase/D-esterase-like protein
LLEVYGYKRAMKSGIGTASRKFKNGLVIGAIAAVNAVGENRDSRTGDGHAGARNNKGQIISSMRLLLRNDNPLIPLATNTTLAVVASNAIFTKAPAAKVAQMAQDGLSRTIFPHIQYMMVTRFLPSQPVK